MFTFNETQNIYTSQDYEAPKQLLSKFQPKRKNRVAEIPLDLMTAEIERKQKAKAAEGGVTPLDFYSAVPKDDDSNRSGLLHARNSPLFRMIVKCPDKDYLKDLIQSKYDQDKAQTQMW